jgi:hypothetical protein
MLRRKRQGDGRRRYGRLSGFGVEDAAFFEICGLWYTGSLEGHDDEGDLAGVEERWWRSVGCVVAFEL